MTAAASRPVRLAIIGDIHDQWTSDDTHALQGLGVDAALFVGDFGNESVDVVRAIAAVPLPKAVILGNHDSWYTATPWGRKKCPYDRTREDRVQQQLDLLGEAHVGYGCLDWPDLGISVVGGRPFSWGGPNWSYAEFYRDRFGVLGMMDSADRIARAAAQATQPALIFLGHNGPHGLGDNPESICGRDWQPLGGDFGDPDLRQAIRTSQQRQQHVALVTFGHMHNHLRHRKDRLRQMTATDAQGTVYLNAAVVPRLLERDRGRLHQFVWLELVAGKVSCAASVWADRTGAIASADWWIGHAPADFAQSAPTAPRTIEASTL